MNFLSLARKRQSERAYLSNLVELEKIKRCLEAAQIAPSACNSQPWKFVVITDASLKDKIAAETANRMIGMNHFTSQAPVIVAVVMESPKFTAKLGSIIKQKQFALMDLGIAVEHFCLQAVEEGLGTCILGWFNEKKVKTLLSIPFNKRLMLLITLGYPLGDVREKSRKSLDKISSYNKY